MHGLFHLTVNFLQPLTLMQIVEVFPLTYGKLGQDKTGPRCLSGFLPFRECPAYTLLYQFSPKDTGQSKVK